MKKPQTRRARPGKNRVAARKKRLTPAEARRRAGQHVIKQMFTGARVSDGTGERMCIYDVTGELAGNPVWFVYPNPEGPSNVIRSSQVIAICQRTGKILYAGSAHDEG